MRAKGSLIILLVVVTLSGISQEFNGGFYGGIAASQLDGDKLDGYNKAGIVAGGYINRYFNKEWAGQLGLRYAQKGSKTDNNVGFYYKAVLHYVEMPVTVRYQHFKKVDFEGGFSLGYLLKAMEKIGSDDFDVADPPFDKFELASLLGVNYHFNKKLAVGAHFSYSILSVRPYSSGYEDFMDKGQHNNVVYFSVAYKLASWR
jgi:hypothetical protein